MGKRDVRTESTLTLLRGLSIPHEVREELIARLTHYNQLLWAFRFPGGLESMDSSRQYDRDHYARRYGKEPEEVTA